MSEIVATQCVVTQQVLDDARTDVRQVVVRSLAEALQRRVLELELDICYGTMTLEAFDAGFWFPITQRWWERLIRRPVRQRWIPAVRYRASVQAEPTWEQRTG